MKTRFQIIFIAILSIIIGVSACKVKEKSLGNNRTTKQIISSETNPVEEEVRETTPPKATATRTVTPTITVKKAPNKYFLISASFKNELNAEKMKTKLKKEGYDSQIFLASNNYYRVSYKGFSNREQAFKELKQARSTKGHEDVWLHIKH